MYVCVRAYMCLNTVLVYRQAEVQLKYYYRHEMSGSSVLECFNKSYRVQY